MRNYGRYGPWTVYRHKDTYYVRRKLDYRLGWTDGNIEIWDWYFKQEKAEEVARALNDV